MTRTQARCSAGIGRAGGEPAVVAAGRGRGVLSLWGVAVVCLGLSLVAVAGSARAHLGPAVDSLDRAP